MTSLQKKLLIVIGVLSLCMCTLASSLFMATKVNPNQLHVRYQTIRDETIGKDAGILSILYFTDLQYGTFQDTKRTENLISAIEELDPSIVIFGGDLYDDAFVPTPESNQALIDFLNRIDAPYGKFSVLGEKDIDETHIQSVRDIYAQTGFEILENKQVQIANAFTLCGLSPSADVSVLANNQKEMFHIVVSHYPDNLVNDALSQDQVSLALAGNSHGTQITYPLLGGYRQTEGSKTLNRSQGASLPFSVIVSAGVGNTRIDARFNADPEIHYFLLSHD